ncbi:TetR/AcrR family transcriptional regulator [Nocardioides lentus]|uniref:TetR/AcrR family transcriptional regulator n=1 Tax=Nocardioides lentus TaxID=338077 RepID=A0ABP5B4Y8_9ACTN
MLARSVELFNTHGYDATSMSDLAAHLGLTKSAIYHHVPSKEALLRAALDEALDGLGSAIDEVAGPDRSAEQRLRAAVEASVRVLVARQPAVTLLLRVRGNSPVEQAALARRRELDQRLTALVREAVEEGALRDDLEPELVSRLLFGTVNSLVEWYRPGGPVSPDDLAAALTTLVFDGLVRR